MPDGVEALQQLGVHLGPQNSAPFLGIRFINGETAACARFPAASGLGIRRQTLHALMVQRAAEIGVALHWRTPFAPGPMLTRARWIVGADGMNSRVRVWAGFDVPVASARRFGFRRHFPVAPWSDTVDVHWGRDCQVYITPVGAKELCIAVISRYQQLRLDKALSCFPDIERRLGASVPTTPERGSVTECRTLSAVTRGNVALIGDASGTVDALTGEGLALSFKQAHALVDALASGNLASYEKAHRALSRTPALMAKLMLSMDGRVWLRRPAIGALAAAPAAFSKLLAIHIGARPSERGNPICVSVSGAA